MGTKITEASETSTTDVRRTNYLAALALAGQIMSESSALPSDFTVAVYAFAPNAPEIKFYFHRDLDGLRQFADERGLTVSATDRPDGDVYYKAVGQPIDNVVVTAWSLVSADAPAVAA